MNPAGISVFYGALDPVTCVAEIRLPVGGLAIVGKFELVRPIRILDLTVFNEPPQPVSMFDPRFDRITVKRAFLSDFHNEMRKPILPKDEDLDYIPTQAVAEYLANIFKPNLDGLIFSSAQTGGKGRNIVIFCKEAFMQVSSRTLT